MRTRIDTIDSLTFSHEAIQSPHFTHGSFRPAFFCDDTFNLVSQGINIFRLGGQLEKRMGKALFDVSTSTRRSTGAYIG